jgi:hypothetical protein
MSASAYEIRSELRGGQTKLEAESRARAWAEGKVG